MANSTTRRRARRATNRNPDSRANDSVQVSFPRAFINRVTAWYRERDSITEALAARLAATAVSQAGSAQSVARTLGMGIGFEGPANNRRQPSSRPRGRPRLTVAAPTAPPQRRARNTSRQATSRSRANQGGLDLQNLGNGTTLADQVARALPNVGQTRTITEIARQCRTSRGTPPNNQAIGGVLNRFQKAGLVNRIGNNEVTTLRELRQSRAA